MRKRLYEIIEASQGDDKASSTYDIVMIAAIIISLIPLTFKEETFSLFVIDKVCAGIFVIDYILRLMTADFKYQKKSVVSFLRYPVSLMAIIDLISILPSLTPLNGGFKVLRVMRMIRATRVLRVFKAARYSKSLQIIGRVFQASKAPLAAVGSLALVYVMVSALIIINVEPDSFDDFFDAIYWATVSLTTMGYGDIYPVTTIGRLVTMLSSVFGIAIVALPSGIITAGYMNEIENEKNKSDSDKKEE
ncbi:MAG: ion transporter [Clostridia bacterium]|nr:ion transporter [Clostridia bacterium]